MKCEFTPCGKEHNRKRFCSDKCKLAWRYQNTHNQYLSEIKLKASRAVSLAATINLWRSVWPDLFRLPACCQKANRNARVRSSRPSRAIQK